MLQKRIDGVTIAGFFGQKLLQGGGNGITVIVFALLGARCTDNARVFGHLAREIAQKKAGKDFPARQIAGSAEYHQIKTLDRNDA